MGAGAGAEARVEEAVGARDAVRNDLRERIRQLEAAPRSAGSLLPTGIEPLDHLLGGGFPRGLAVELCGPEASGRASFALRTLATVGANGGGNSKLTAYVDPAGQLYGPSALALGVALESLLVVRPQSAAQAVWAAVQLCRSGAMGCVVLDLTGTPHRLTPSESKRLSDAAFRSGGLLLLLTEPERPGDGGLRLRVEPRGLEGVWVEVLRARRLLQRETLIPWEAIPHAPTHWRHRPPEAIRQASVTRLRICREPRPDPALSRNGPVGVHGSRPGRDLSMPSLENAQGMGG